MVSRSISLSVAQKQLLAGCREQLGIKDTKKNNNKKMLFQSTKNVSFCQK